MSGTGISINLMPAARVRAAKKRARMRAWVVGGVAYAMVLGIGAAAVIVRTEGVDNIAEKLAASAARGQELKAQIRQVRAAIARNRREADSVRQVQEHPDWSVLLASMDQAAGPGLILDRCEVMGVQEPETGKKEKAAPAPGFRMSIAGLATSNAAVAEFSAHLEGLRLFESVSIVSIRARDGARAAREGGPEGPALYAFDIVCTLSDIGAASADASGGDH